MREQDIQKMARKVLPESYTDNWQEKQAIWCAGAIWADENSIIEDLRMEISDKKDEIWHLEYKHEEEIAILQQENKSLIEQVEKLQAVIDKNTEIK